jgi:hypothetical protein
MKKNQLKITVIREFELSKLFDEVFYRLFEIHDENEKLARSIRETLKKNNLGDFSRRWGRNSTDLKRLTPYDFLLNIEKALTPPEVQDRAQLAQSRVYDIPHQNWANFVKKAGATLSDSRTKQSNQEKETKDAILNGLEKLVEQRGRMLAEELGHQRNSLVQGWRDELRHLAGLSSLETEIKSSLGAMRTMKSSQGTAMKSSLGAEMTIKDSRSLAKGKASMVPQDDGYDLNFEDGCW